MKRNETDKKQNSCPSQSVAHRVALPADEELLPHAFSPAATASDSFLWHAAAADSFLWHAAAADSFLWRCAAFAGAWLRRCGFITDVADCLDLQKPTTALFLIPGTFPYVCLSRACLGKSMPFFNRLIK